MRLLKCLTFCIFLVIICDSESDNNLSPKDLRHAVEDIKKRVREESENPNNNRHSDGIWIGELEFPLEAPTAPPNITFKFSPVTLDRAWTKLERLLFLVFSSFFGSLMNGFFVSAFFVEPQLKRTGNVYLACLGLSDLLMTAGVIPAAAVVLLSGEWDTIPVCHTLYFGAMTAIYSHSMFFLLVSLENYIQLFCSTHVYESFLSLPIGLFCGTVYFLSAVLAGVGVYFELDVDYCQRKHQGNMIFRAVTGILFHVIPAVLTFVTFIVCAIGIKRKARKQPMYKRSQQYERDHSINNLNIFAFILYIGSWIPYVYVSYRYPEASNYKYYYCVWVGLFRPVINSIFYCMVNSNFKSAFVHLFNYCCCKSSLSNNLNRHRRGVDYKSTTGDVRVHIMHKAVGAGSPQRSTSAAREMQEL